MSGIISLLRVSYNGYYVTFPRLRQEFDSPYPHQIGTRTEIVARMRCFFFGRAQREPDVFLGGMKKLVVIYDDISVLYF